ncbi:FHA domain containing protein [Intrasporangium calvum DSM 43043]|uniref:FHA domain containing protein n=1 Tax=Intrasporangium calvum (strain ATCC 23552 / DSM 43043 / JCM 3097 / NBRC 12989 / NCIMB 10167 / NRRL B-3866 / 7 KIP) TaxID=710696 RepID=E6S652_INTC7|nr:FHA domain containing protein [Intrasporangium calvum DSM 43043]
MRLRMGLVDPSTARVRDVVIDTDENGDTPGEHPVTFKEVRPRLAELLHRRPGTFFIDGHPVTDEAVLGEGRLIRGALLRADDEARDAAPGEVLPPGLVQVHVVGGPGAGRVIHLARGEHVVGRATSSGVRLDDHGVSRAHASITIDDAGIRLRELEATNPTYVDEARVPPDGAALSVGDRIRVASTTLVLRRPDTTPAASECSRGSVRVNRRPRFTPHTEPVTIRFPERPTRPPATRAPVLAALAPLAISVALAAALRSPVMLLFALMSPVMLLTQWWGDRRHGRVSHRSQLADHARLTAEAESLLDDALAAEREARHDEQPDLALVASVATHRDARLWERRTGDTDHLVLRVGTARQAARTRVEAPDESRADPTVPDVPVVLDLGVGVIGVAGPRARTRAAVSSLVAQASVWHSPRSTRVVIISAAPDAERDWAWATWLPHAAGPPSGPVALVASVDDEAAVVARVAELLTVIDSRTRPANGVGVQARAVPRFLVVLDGAAELRGRAGIAAILEAAPSAGVHVVALDETAERLPAECRAQLVLDEGPAPRAELHLDDATIRDIVPDLPHPAWVGSLARSLAPLEDVTPETGSSALPDAITLAAAHALTGHEPTQAPVLVQLWSTSDGRPRAVLGVAQDGPFVVDLAQDGPHCLVGGTTGSGKSELLQTLVVGLAVSTPPDELAFVLVDYKGGSAFKECAQLPHCLGVVTDLDEHLTRRALESLGAEVKRREALLAEAGAKDLDDYRRVRSQRGELEPLARLVIVVDEFKMLADELPDFVDGLVRIAAVGRSLGVHLVLATQRPAGIITGDMRANVSLRIALRVRDRSDSDDVIESPVAAAVSDQTPGRAWVRTGGGRLSEVQTAFAGASTSPCRPTQPHLVSVRELTWADLARPLTVDRPAGADTGSSELQAVVAAAKQAAAALGVVGPPSPWLPPLPASLSRSTLTGDRPAGAVALGLEDAPALQAQMPYTWHPVSDGNLAIAGGARTGRTTTARALAVGLAEHWPPTQLHLHVIEGTPGSLRDLASLPHVGSVTSTADPALAARVIARLTDATTRGHQLPDDPAGTGSPTTSDDRRCHTVLLVDGWESVEDAFEAVDHGAPAEALLRLARDGMAAGLRLVVTGGRGLISGRVSSLVQHRLVLPMTDPIDLTLAGLSPELAQGHHGVGRAIDVATGHQVQLAHVGADPESGAQVRTTVAVAERLRAGLWRDSAVGAAGAAGGLPWRVAPLPHAVAWNDLPPAGPDWLVLGLGGDDARPLGFEAGWVGRRALVVGGPRSGRSTVLATMARQLADAGRPTVVVATRRTPLSWLAGTPQFHLVSAQDGGRLRQLREAHPDLSVLVDDAEGLDGSPAEPVVLEVAHDLGHPSSWCVAAVDARRAASLYRGVVPELARHATGVVLSPVSPNDGDVLGIRVEIARHRLPGRGVIVLDGATLPIQVADPRLPPDPRSDLGRSTKDRADTGCSPPGDSVPPGPVPRDR